MNRIIDILRAMTGKKIFAACLFLAVSCSAEAQIKFSVSAPKSVPVNQNFQVDFILENGSLRAMDPTAAFADFQVLGGPNESHSVQVVNNHVSQSAIYSFILRPKKEGVFKIDRVSADVGGAHMESSELTITVTGPVKQQPQQAQQRPRDPFFDDDPFQDNHQQEQPKTSSADVQKQLKDLVLVRIVTDKNSVYVGERITATVKLYFRQVNIAGNVGMPKAPSFDGFWSQEVELPKERKPHTETLNGQQFYVAEIQQYNLYPQKTGTLTISPAEMEMVVQAAVQRAHRSFFDNFFGQPVQNFQYKTTSNAQSITVKNVPSAGQPANYSGAVGKFNYSVKLSSTEGKTDNAVTYSVKLTGVGNLKTIELPKPELPDGFEVFDPKTKEDIANTATGMSGTKQYDYLIIPRQPGDYKIAGTSFSYFDPSAGKYITLSSPELSLKVTGTPSQNLNTNTIAQAGKEDVSALHSDIRFIKTKTAKMDKSGAPFFGSAGYVGLLASPILLFAGLIFVKRRNEDLAADLAGTKRRRATKLAKKRFTSAQTYLAKNDKKGFYDEVSRALWGYLGDKLNIDQSQLSKENVEEKLLAKNVKADTIAKLLRLINTSEQALYSPVGAGDEMKQNYDTGIALITDLEEEIK